jgi:hypothetical protein
VKEGMNRSDERMAEDLERLCSNISLTDGEKIGITVTEGEIADIREKGANCLVGKLWTEKAVNKEAFKDVLSRIWRMVGRVIFKELQDNCWLFEFSGNEDKRRVLEGRPWSFDRFVLVLNEFDGKTPPSQMQFRHSPIWVQIHDMPLLCMTKVVGEKIGASLGVLEDVDVAGDGVGWGRCLRIRVIIDLSNPLERGRALSIGGKSVWVSFKYEKLPLFCFHCGRIVHEKQGCSVRRSPRVHVDERDKQWGIWLRADDLRRERGRNDKGRGGGWFSNTAEDSDSAGGYRAETPPEKESTGCMGTHNCSGQRGTKELQNETAAGGSGAVMHGLSQGNKEVIQQDSFEERASGKYNKEKANIGESFSTSSRANTGKAQVGVSLSTSSRAKEHINSLETEGMVNRSEVEANHTVEPLPKNRWLISGLEKGADRGENLHLDLLLGSKGSDGEIIHNSSTVMPMTGVTIDGDNISGNMGRKGIKGWKRQARSTKTPAQSPLRGGPTARKKRGHMVVGPQLKVGCPEATMKRNKTLGAEFEELAEAVIQPRQQP